jgi:hypothetical protein
VAMYVAAHWFHSILGVPTEEGKKLCGVTLLYTLGVLDLKTWKAWSR